MARLQVKTVHHINTQAYPLSLSSLGLHNYCYAVRNCCMIVFQAWLASS